MCLSCLAALITGILEFPDDFAFLGALIIKEVVKELLPRGLAEAQVLILTGSR